MNIVVIGCSFRNTPVGAREKLVFPESALPGVVGEINARFGTEAVIVSTCNRVEIYLARSGEELPPSRELVAEFVAESLHRNIDEVVPWLHEIRGDEAVLHLLRVTSSLDSLVIGEGQIAGQVRDAFELARKVGSTGPIFNLLFPTALRAAKRARTETDITKGHVSISSVAVDYVRGVFDRFDNKTVLVVGAGKMGRRTLKHLSGLRPRRILVTNRSPEKAVELAAECDGVALPWDQLDDGIAQADIILSATGASEPIMSRNRYREIRPKRSGESVVILDIAVPRDFDPRIGGVEGTFLFNVDDMERICAETIAERQKHAAPAEVIVRHEQQKFLADWNRRRHGPVIERLNRAADLTRQEVLTKLLSRLDGKLSEPDWRYVEKAFEIFQSRLLHAPINTLRESSADGTSAGMIDALRRLFRLE